MCFPPPGGEPLEGLGLGPCSPVLPTVLSVEEVANPTAEPEAPWLELRLQPTWERVPALSAFLPH